MGLVIYSQLQFLFCLFTAIYSFIISSKMIKADLLKKTSERVCNQQAPRCFFSQILQNMWALNGKILVSSDHVCNHQTPGYFFSQD